MASVNYSVKAAARATGVSESRLRTWERRYGVPHPGRSASGRRLYSDEDLQVVRRMAALVGAGLSAVDAAEAARQPETPEAAAVIEHKEHALVATLLGAVDAYDEERFLAVLKRAEAELGWAGALESVAFVALERMGAAWQAASLPPAKEHFASELIRRFLLEALGRVSPSPTAQPLLVMACPEGERHDLGLAALHLLLRQAGVHVIYLGADVPTADLLEIVAQLKPRSICLAAASSAGFASLARASRSLVSRDVRVFFAGNGSGQESAGVAGVRLPAALAEAAEMLVRNMSTGTRD